MAGSRLVKQQDGGLSAAALSGTFAALTATPWGKAPVGAYLSPPWVTATTSADTVQNRLRLTPLILSAATNLDRIGVEVTVAGEASSVLRLGIFSDTGNMYPNSLILDAGTVPGDGATGWKEITIAQALPAGIYWLGVTPQLCATTRPTLRSGIGLGLVPPNQTMPTSLNRNESGYAVLNYAAGAYPAGAVGTATTASPSPIIAVRKAA